MKYFIYNFTFIPHRLLTTNKLHRYRKVTGSNPVEVLTFSGFYIRNCITCAHNCEAHSLLDFTSAVQYMKYFIYNFSFIPHRLLRAHKWRAPNITCFIAQLLTALHRYHEVTGSNPVEILTFSGLYTRNCINCIHNSEDRSLLDFTSAVQYMKYFLYNLTFIPHRLLRTHKWPAINNATGFIAQFDRALHRYREVTGSNDVEFLTFSGFYIGNCITCIHNCEDHSLLDFTSIYEIFHI